MDFRRITPSRLGQSSIGTSNTIVHTVVASSRSILKTFDICNTTSNLIKVNVYVVPSGSVVGTDNALFYEYPLQPNIPIQWTGTQIMNEGDTLVTKADTIGSTITASGGIAQ